MPPRTSSERWRGETTFIYAWSNCQNITPPHFSRWNIILTFSVKYSKYVSSAVRTKYKSHVDSQRLSFSHENGISGLSLAHPSSYMMDISSGSTLRVDNTSSTGQFNRFKYPVHYYFVNFTKATRIPRQPSYPSSTPSSPGRESLLCSFQRDVRDCGIMFESLLANVSCSEVEKISQGSDMRYFRFHKSPKPSDHWLNAWRWAISPMNFSKISEIPWTKTSLRVLPSTCPQLLTPKKQKKCIPVLRRLLNHGNINPF